MTRPKVIFPRVTRQDADKDLLHMVKYLINYVFFKFGIEVKMVFDINLNNLKIFFHTLRLR